MEIVTLAPRVYECTECGNQITTKTNHRGENIEFDPIAWCCEFSEYDSLAEAYKEKRYDYTYVEDEAREYFEDNTTLIELDNGHVIIGEF